MGTDETGAAVTDCYADIAVSDVTEKMIVLDVEHVNLLTDGDFEKSPAMNLYSPSTTSDTVAKAVGAWYSNARWPSRVPTISTDADGNAVATIARNGTLMQYAALNTDADSRLTYTVDPTGLETSQSAYFMLTFYDKDFNALNFLNPIDNSTIAGLYNLQNITADIGKRTKQVLFAFDCDDHYKYKAGDGTYASDVTYNQCEDAAGNPQTNALGVPYTADDVAFVGVEFAGNWGGAGTFTIDDVKLEVVGDTQIKLFDSDSTEISSSDGADFLYADSSSTASTIRIALRTTVAGKSPKVKSVTLDNQTLAVTAGDQLTSFTEPRLGISAGSGPVQDWYDNTTIRSLCRDPFTGEDLGWLDFLVKYNVTNLRNYIPFDFYRVTQTGKTNIADDNYSFSVYTGAYENNLEPETLLYHFKEISDAGIHLLMIIEPNMDGIYFDKKYPGWFDTGAATLAADYDYTPDDDTDDSAQTLDLIKETIAFTTKLFSGSTTVTNSNAETFTVPKITDWQMGVETNLLTNETMWMQSLSSEEQASAWSEIAAAFLAADPTLSLQTSVNPRNNAVQQAFDYEYLESTVAHMDADQYTHFNFNTFNDTELNQPEDWIEALDELKTKDYFKDWADKKFVVGAYDYETGIYDPNCNEDNEYEPDSGRDWERSFGNVRQAQLIARQVLTQLYMPIEAMYDYVIFTGEGFSGRNLTTTADPCWKSSGKSELLVRIADTGIIAGIDEASIYEVNEAGLGYFTLGKHVSKANSIETTVSGLDNIHAALYKTYDGDYYLAVWQVSPDVYASDYMAYASGAYDVGYTQARKIDVTLSGVTQASQISLSETTQTELTVSNAIIQGVLLDGDMPALIKLRM